MMVMAMAVFDTNVSQASLATVEVKFKQFLTLKEQEYINGLKLNNT